MTLGQLQMHTLSLWNMKQRHNIHTCYTPTAPEKRCVYWNIPAASHWRSWCWIVQSDLPATTKWAFQFLSIHNAIRQLQTEMQLQLKGIMKCEQHVLLHSTNPKWVRMSKNNSSPAIDGPHNDCEIWEVIDKLNTYSQCQETVNTY